MKTPPAHYTVRVWDLPTRLFHWSLVAVMAGLFATAWLPGHWIDWHARLGQALLALLLFRLVWGVVGGHWSRFTSFLPTPGRLGRYLGGTRDARGILGHSPLGALSVVAMLLALGAQVGTGLVSDDEIAFTGPLNALVSSAAGLAATAWHRGSGKLLVIALVVMHIVAIAFYRWKRQRNLVPAMVHGDKLSPVPGPASRDDSRSRALAALVFTGCAVGTWALVRLGG